jgi:hypothetical protein
MRHPWQQIRSWWSDRKARRRERILRKCHEYEWPSEAGLF